MTNATKMPQIKSLIDSRMHKIKRAARAART